VGSWVPKTNFSCGNEIYQEKVNHMLSMWKEYSILVGTPEEKKILGRPKCKWENNTKMLS
jgi:hypothetical protein